MIKYISGEGENAIRNFKYKGGSVAYSYEYIWSPMAEYFLNFIPMNWAPNSITLLGTIINITGSLSLIMQQRGQKLIPWTLLFFGTCVIVYLTLDNIDGKQARRTGNSSPLGMCMDHGCDALGVSFITLAVGQMIMMDSQSALLISGQIALSGSFWLSTWAQYHSKGVLILGKFNAVDDGIPFISFLGYFTYFMGQTFWIQQIIWGYQVRHCLVLFVWVAGVIQIFGFVKNSGQNFTKDLKGAFSHFLHFGMILTSLITIIYFTDWQKRYFLPIFFSSVLPVVRDTSYMHICVVAQQKYNQFQFPTVFYSLVFPIYIGIRQVFGFSLIPENIFVYGVLAVIVLSYFDYVASVSRQMAQAINVRIFHIKNKNK